ncbi:hypothetical protein NGRA_3452, partial [Nosema granulosis]
MISSSNSRHFDQQLNPSSHGTLSNSPSKHQLILGLPLFILNPEKAKLLEKNYFSLSFPLNYGTVELSIKPQQTIYRFQNPQIQDPLEWCRTLRKVAILNQWINETALIILEDLLDKKYLQQLHSKKTLDTKLDLFCEILFPYKEFNLYRKSITKINRSQFTSFEDFLQVLEDLRKRADLCGQSRLEKVPESDLIEVVLRNLNVREREYLAQCNAYTIEEIQTAMRTFQENQIFFNLSYSGINQKTDNNPSAFQTPRRYCYYHKTNFHDAKDCKYLQTKGKHLQSSKQAFSATCDTNGFTLDNLPTTKFQTNDKILTL